jgi:hypothetical protein
MPVLHMRTGGPNQNPAVSLDDFLLCRGISSEAMNIMATTHAAATYSTIRKLVASISRRLCRGYTPAKPWAKRTPQNLPPILRHCREEKQSARHKWTMIFRDRYSGFDKRIAV